MIRSGKMDEVQGLITRLGGEIKSLIKSCLEISYYSRGAWNYELVLKMSQAERELAADFINERLEIASKSPFPVF